MSRSRRTEGVPADRSARIRASTRALAAAPLFKEIKVLVFPKFLEKEAEAEDVVELVFNKNNTQVGTFEILKTETEFYKLRLNLVWEILLKKEEKNKKKIEVKEKIQSSLLKEIAENKLTSKQKLILDEKEREDKKQKKRNLKII